jgi:pimeloyl-ACP methyl ester carboxylesterase
VIVLVGSGCASRLDLESPQTGARADFGEDTTLIFLTGIGGLRTKERGWVEALGAGGFRGRSEMWDWTGRLDPLPALWASGRQRAMARRVAERIRAARAKRPSAPIVLVGYSGGAGVAAYALEALPPDVDVDELVLLAPALSRNYDLTRALRHVRGPARVFSNGRDTLVLALGTSLFGTVDGVHAEAAGCGGFVRPGRAGADAYARLRTHRYSRARQLAGDNGSHAGVLAKRVASELVAPLLPGFPPPGAALADAGGRTPVPRAAD